MRDDVLTIAHRPQIKPVVTKQVTKKHLHERKTFMVGMGFGWSGGG